MIQNVLESRPSIAKFWMLGSHDEKPVGEQIVISTDAHRVKNLMGVTDLPVVVELLKRSVMLVTNDSGPMHLAAALGIPTVSFFGPTDPQKTGPFGDSHKIFQTQVECSPCFHRKCPLNEQLCFFDSINSREVAEYIVDYIADNRSRS